MTPVSDRKASSIPQKKREQNAVFKNWRRKFAEEHCCLSLKLFESCSPPRWITSFWRVWQSNFWMSQNWVRFSLKLLYHLTVLWGERKYKKSHIPIVECETVLKETSCVWHWSAHKELLYLRTHIYSTLNFSWKQSWEKISLFTHEYKFSVAKKSMFLWDC